MMKLRQVIDLLKSRFSGLVAVDSWGETGLFYNPRGSFARGKYFVTFKENDGDNDKASELHRSEVEYRMNLKIDKQTFLKVFALERMPTRAPAGGTIGLPPGYDYDPTRLDTIMPHPVYGWMSWISVINPSETTITEMLEKGYFQQSYANACKLAGEMPDSASVTSAVNPTSATAGDTSHVSSGRKRSRKAATA